MCDNCNELQRTSIKPTHTQTSLHFPTYCLPLPPSTPTHTPRYSQLYRSRILFVLLHINNQATKWKFLMRISKPDTKNNTTRHSSPINQPRPIPYSYTLTHLKTTQSTDLNNHVQLKPSLSHYPYRHTAIVLHTLETSTTGFKTTLALQAYCTSYSH